MDRIKLDFPNRTRKPINLEVRQPASDHDRAASVETVIRSVHSTISDRRAFYDEAGNGDSQVQFIIPGFYRVLPEFSVRMLLTIKGFIIK